MAYHDKLTWITFNSNMNITTAIFLCFHCSMPSAVQYHTHDINSVNVNVQGHYNYEHILTIRYIQELMTKVIADLDASA